jgi:hypothetical protein
MVSKFGAAADGARHRPATRDQFEIHEFYLGSAPGAIVLAVPPDLVDQRLQFGEHRIELDDVVGERAIGADRLPDPICPGLRDRRRLAIIQ